MKEIELSKGKVAIVDDEDYEYLSQWKWSLSSKGKGRKNLYAVRANKKSIISMHRQIMKFPENFFIDHINGDGLDNQKDNLRLCNNQENSSNQKKHSNNKNGYKGVYTSNRSKKFMAKVFYKGVSFYLGTFATKEDAAIAYDKKALEIFGEFALLNFPEVTE